MANILSELSPRQALIRWSAALCLFLPSAGAANSAKAAESFYGLHTSVAVALITAIVALIGVAVNGYFTWRNAANQKELAGANALMSYQFEARKRLYTECEPLLFQLSEACEAALRRCELLATRKVCDRLAVQRLVPDQTHSFMLSRDTELIASAYALLHPLALFCLLREKMTRVDCSLDPVVSFQYRLVRHLYLSFHDDECIAAQSPVLPYDPRVKDWQRKRLKDPRKYWWQGVTPGRLDRAVRLLTIREHEARRVMTYGEFEDLYVTTYEGGEAKQQKTLGVFANPLYNFTPHGRPVFWRLILVQAHLHHALTQPIPRDIEEERRSPMALSRYLNLPNPDAFALTDKGWGKQTGPAEDPIDTARTYLITRLSA